MIPLIFHPSYKLAISSISDGDKILFCLLKNFKQFVKLWHDTWDLCYINKCVWFEFWLFLSICLVLIHLQ